MFFSINSKKYIFLKFLIGLFLYFSVIVSLTTATSFCNNCQCCSSTNHLTNGQYSEGNNVNENEINLNRNDHFATSPQLTFSIPNAKPIPLLETENGLQKYYKIDYNGINPTNLNQNHFPPQKPFYFQFPLLH
uniref:Uncharacterized protein n=1 Tax=Meloidogyne enterolobii TaxID=390850 RepID=A0A6V7VDK7_MELEN|nr:unnamed protein product [Meloidogyne enterolobii]